MLAMLIKGMAIGIVLGIPAGAVGAMTIHRVMLYNRKAGLLTGLGSSVADVFFACIGAFGLTLIADFLMKYRIVFGIFGSALLVFLGVRLLLDKKETKSTEYGETSLVKMFLSALAIAITNPVSIVTYLFAFSWLDVSGNIRMSEAALLVLGVFIGGYLWWIFLTILANSLKKKSAVVNMRYLNRGFGVVLLIFAVVILVRSLIA